MKMFNLCAFFVGMLFGVGLTIAGLTDPERINSFLNLFGNWDPGLLLIMAAALGTTLISFRFILKRKAPFLAPEFHLPNSSVIEKKLVFGSALFGIGWGLYGYCPGAVISAIAYLHTNTFIFLLAMLLGMFAAHLLMRKSIET
ncbi:MAG: DUF6691 family protein [Arenicella sp.]